MDLNLIQALKDRGYVAVKFVLRERPPGTYQALVEVIPTRSKETSVDFTSLYSSDILHYLSDESSMARYIINPDYLADNNKP